MINNEILGGLKAALDRGESLKRAMMTLYNSGYRKEEIEESARRLIESSKETHANFPIQEIQGIESQIQQPKEIQKPVLAIQRTIPSIRTAKFYPTYAPIQRASYYEEGITSREKAIIIVLVLLLVFLISVLGLIFLFKQEIINFFGNFFSQ
jgi:hypothetical protein